MLYVPRTLERCFLKANEKFNVVLLSGMRRVGKSTLLREKAQNRNIISLDDFQAYEIARKARNLFFKQYQVPILIDEIQRAPDLNLEIKALVDRERKPGLVWLTGSQRFSLMKSVVESLAGRMADFELLPFSLYERQNKAFEQVPYEPKGEFHRGTLEAQDNETLWKIIWQGSWPELIEMNADERHWFFTGFLHSYLERDVREAGNIGKLAEFHKFLGILASRIGQEFQIGKVACEAGISAPTAKEWLSVAEASGIIWLLPPFYENVGKTLIKKPKLYFTETGLAAWLMDIPSAQALRSSYLAGAFFENFVLSELRKSWVHNGRRASFYFYRDTRLHEIDLLIKLGTQYLPVEIKMTHNPTTSMVQAFDCLKGKKFSCGPGSLICLTQEQRFLREDVIAHSVWDI